MDLDCHMIGYPDHSIIELTEEQKEEGVSKLKPEGHNMFYMEGKIEHIVDACTTGGLCAAYSMDCSPGQDGGAVVNKVDGCIMGIFSRVENLDEIGDSFYMATFIDEVFMTWFNALQFIKEYMDQ